MFLLRSLRARAEALDNLSKPRTHVSEHEVYDYISQENGMIRLKRAFSRSDDGELSPEIKFYVDNYANKSSGTVIVFVSAMYSCLKNNVLIKDMPKNESSKTFWVRSIKDTVKISVKYFSTIAVFFGITETIAIYRNKTSPFEFGLAGGVIVGLMRAVRGGQAQELPESIAKVVKQPLHRVSHFGAIRNGTIIGLVIGLVLTYVANKDGISQEKRHIWNVQNKLRKEKEKEFEGQNELRYGPDITKM